MEAPEGDGKRLPLVCKPVAFRRTLLGRPVTDYVGELTYGGPALRKIEELSGYPICMLDLHCVEYIEDILYIHIGSGEKEVKLIL